MVLVLMGWSRYSGACETSCGAFALYTQRRYGSDPPVIWLDQIVCIFRVLYGCSCYNIQWNSNVW
jgi:hypothetical protein